MMEKTMENKPTERELDTDLSLDRLELDDIDSEPEEPSIDNPKKFQPPPPPEESGTSFSVQTPHFNLSIATTKNDIFEIADLIKRMIEDETLSKILQKPIKRRNYIQ